MKSIVFDDDDKNATLIRVLTKHIRVLISDEKTLGNDFVGKISYLEEL